MSTLDEVIARVLNIPVEDVDDELGYQSVRQWDSLGHVTLMVALENEFGWDVTDETMLELRSVAALRRHAAAVSGSAQTPQPRPPQPEPAPVPVTVHRGLEGIVFDRSAVTYIGGAEGVLEYRGYSIHDLAARSRFEEVAHLLIHGRLPDHENLRAFEKELASQRRLPDRVLELVYALRDAKPVDALRTCVSALGAFESEPSDQDESFEAARNTGTRLLAQVPTLIAAHHAVRSGRDAVEPPEGGSHAEAFLTMLLGESPSPATVEFINRSLIVHADHSANASAFSARIAVSCRAGMTAAITSAIAAFSGSVHGGAAERVLDQIDAVGRPEHAAEHVRRLRALNQPVMGFGHRVYRTEDPRVRHLRASVEELSREHEDFLGLRVADAISAEMSHYTRLGVAPNVDLYAGLAYRLIGLPKDLAVPMFVAGRTAGWVAQALEQHENNVLIRPLLEYTGPHGLPYPKAVS
ncbi:citrate/2-methylcitrate synthase [Streptomyces sp. NPDC001851]|uniref:citrate/2-methylcitrate synthase n=1 Tax=Streptomyces sp. NPDC001851 TaxID=3154529 RepID=UPI003322A0DE